MVDHEITAAEAVIDNGKFGTRTIRFETGKLAQQAAGSAVAYFGDSMLLSATTASKHPKDQFDFFPLTVDVEERMYAAGRIPGSFFRREGRPSEDAILTCRLTDRPLRPSFVKGLRNEVQVVITVLALDPDHLYDVIAINAASMSTQLAGLPFSGPIGAVRVAHIEGQWVAFPTTPNSSGPPSTWSSPAASLPDGDVAIMMVEAEATAHTFGLVRDGAKAPTEDVVAEGLEASKAFIKILCEAQLKVAAGAAKPTAEFPVFLDYQDDVYAAVAAAVTTDLAQALTIAAKQERETELDRVKALAVERVAPVRGSREGDRRRVPVADQEARAPARPARQGPHRRPRSHRHPAAVRRGQRAPAGARLGAVRARRDADPRRHDAEHAAHGAAARHARAGEAQALHAQLQLPAVLDR